MINFGKYKKYKNVWLWRAVLSVSLIFLLGTLLGSTVRAIARGYNTVDQGLQTGMVAALSLGDSQVATVERATQDSSDRVIGIVTTIDDSLVTVSSGASKVLIESEGQVDGYVSDMNGLVKKGDLVILSPLKGILMKADANTSAPIIAVAADNPQTASPYTYSIESKTLSTNIAKTQLNLNQVGTKNNSAKPDLPLARIGKSIVGKDIGEVRVLIALIIFVLVLIAEGSILYGAISSAVTALGRNPLARKIIRAELFRVIIVAVIVLIVGLGAVYGILWV